MRILILGASGMLGHMLLAELSQRPAYEVYGTVRSFSAATDQLPPPLRARLHAGVSAEDFASVVAIVQQVRPEVVINCIGLIRQRPEGRQSLPCIEINARFPHLVLALCRQDGIRLIHYSTDCVFDGHKGAPYTEDDPVSAKDVYGLTKYLGEVREAPALTIRTSIIGPELTGKLSLVEWFLAQHEQTNGYTHAIYSGLPTCEQARILADYVLPRPDLCGLYQAASQPISKYELLGLVAEAYNKSITIVPSGEVREDKRLSGEAFAAATGYYAPSWPDLVRAMRRADCTRVTS